ncbi:MAG: glycosyltransferase family 4 protein [Candidatus Competibacter denitrificans]
MAGSDNPALVQPGVHPAPPVLRIAHFSPGGAHGRGGMGRFLAYLIPALQRRHPVIQCRVIDTYGPGPFALMPFYFAAALACLLWQALWRQTDLIHIHMAAFGSTARKLLLAAVARSCRLPVLLHLHGSELAKFIDGLTPRQRHWLVSHLKRADALVVLGHYWRDYVIENLGIPPDQVTIVLNGVPDPGWRRTATPDSNPKPCQLLALGELGPRKGSPEILAALASPGLQERAWSAVLAGNGPVAHYQAEVLQRGLTTRVSLPGWVDRDQAGRLLSQSDILLLPSRSEGLPIAILEAMAAGVAVIATPVGAIPDAITDNETGLLIPPGNAAALAEAIAHLIDDPPLRERLAAAARQRFEERFNIDRAADQVSEIYRALTQNTGDKRR